MNNATPLPRYSENGRLVFRLSNFHWPTSTAFTNYVLDTAVLTVPDFTGFQFLPCVSFIVYLEYSLHAA